MICSYCKTENPKDTTICNFCEADLIAERPSIDPMLSEDMAYHSKPQLEKLHTYDLLLILRHLRAKRSNMYKTMQVVRKAPSEAKIDNYDELNEAGQEMYRNLTARQNIVQELLVDRMGYYPLRIDNKLLDALNKRIERYYNNVKPKQT